MAFSKVLKAGISPIALMYFVGIVAAVAEEKPATDASDPSQPKTSEKPKVDESSHVLKVDIGDGYTCRIDTAKAPDLTKWAQEELAPVVKQWYPKIAKMLPSDGYEAPSSFSISISAESGGVAATSGTHIQCSAEWFQRNLKGEAKGAVVHELVHVVQQYGRGRRNNPDGKRPPGWLVEGIADYIRWYLYEPESRGAEISRRNLNSARYDGSYRVSANFLNWVIANHDREIVTKLNAAMREGRYTNDLWKEFTGRSANELGDEWKANLERQLKDENKQDKGK
jgi:hypothetical protein